MRTLTILCAAFTAVTLGLASFAQDRSANARAGQAGFRISVIVVPEVAPPRHQPRHSDRDEAAVTYNLDPRQEKLSVTEELRPMLVRRDNGVARQEQVRIVTVVAK